MLEAWDRTTPQIFKALASDPAAPSASRRPAPGILDAGAAGIDVQVIQIPRLDFQPRLRQTTFMQLRWTVFISTAAVLVVLAGGAVELAAQTPDRSIVAVTVTDPMHRLVTGLERAHFEVLENGVRRNITGFLEPGSPISVAIVTDAPSDIAGILGRDDELIQTPSISNALRQLAASKPS